MLIGCDIDGTLLDYNYIPGAIPDVNIDLIRQFRRDGVDEITLISNQGGLSFGVQGIERKDGRGYPMPEDFVKRSIYLYGALALQGVHARALFVCTHHPRASADSCLHAAHNLDVMMDRVAQRLLRFVYNDAAYRKPKPRMLIEASIDRYYGDSDEDEQAAGAAGIEFVRVPRFFGVANAAGASPAA